MSDQNNAVILTRISDHFEMDFRHQRARRIDDVKLPTFRFTPHFRTYAVSTEDCDRTIGNFGKTLNKNGAACGQIFDDKPVVNDFLANIDRSAKLLQSNEDNVYSADYACAKAARFWEQNSFLWQSIRSRSRNVNDLADRIVSCFA